MYFDDEGSARACAAALPGYTIRIDPPDEDITVWLLRAGRIYTEAEFGNHHQTVARIVERHGGDYDFGESTFVHGVAVPDPILEEEG